jgi:hypothetical protein
MGVGLETPLPGVPQWGRQGRFGIQDPLDPKYRTDIPAMHRGIAEYQETLGAVTAPGTKEGLPKRLASELMQLSMALPMGAVEASKGPKEALGVGKGFVEFGLEGVSKAEGLRRGLLNLIPEKLRGRAALVFASLKQLAPDKVRDIVDRAQQLAPTETNVAGLLDAIGIDYKVREPKEAYEDIAREPLTSLAQAGAIYGAARGGMKALPRAQVAVPQAKPVVPAAAQGIQPKPPKPVEQVSKKQIVSIEELADPQIARIKALQHGELANEALALLQSRFGKAEAVNKIARLSRPQLEEIVSGGRIRAGETRIATEGIAPTISESVISDAIQTRLPQLRKPDVPRSPTQKPVGLTTLEAGGLSKVGDILDRTLTNDPATITAKTGQEAIGQRAGQMAVARHESRLFNNQLRKDLTRAEREDMIFVRQKTANAFIKNDTPGKAEFRLSQKAKDYLKDVDTRIKKNWDELVELGIYDNKLWIENYLHQAWDMPRKKAEAFSHGFRTNAPTGRKLSSYIEGIEAKGYKPRFTDIADLLEHQEGLLTEVKYNRQLVKQMRKWKDPETKKPLLMLASDKGVPDTYKFIDSEPLAKAIRPGYPATPGGKDWIVKRGVKVAVHPEIYDSMRQVFDRPRIGKIGNIIDWYNAITKKTSLSVSFFHPIALGESSGGTGIALLDIMRSPHLALKGYKLLKDKAFYEEPLRAGLQIGSTGDINLTKINRMLNATVRKTKGVPGVHQVAKGVQTFNRMWDKGLWDYFHNGLKMYYYYATKERILRKNPDIAPKIVSQEVAKVMNDAFGGQADLVFGSPKTRRVLQRIFLAPDWTYSNIRIAYRALESEKGARAAAQAFGKDPAMVGELGQRARIRGQIGRRYAFNMALQYFMAAQGLNLALSGKPTWENEPGHKWDINIGKIYGKQYYVKIMKQAREPGRYFIDAIESIKDLPEDAHVPKILGYKLSPFIHTVTEQITGKTTTGWKMPWTKRWPTEKIDPAEAWKQRGVALASKVAPFAARKVIPGLTREPLPLQYGLLPLPVSKGMTASKFIREYAKAYRDKDEDLKETLIKAAKDNDVKNLSRLIGIAISQARD